MIGTIHEIRHDPIHGVCTLVVHDEFGDVAYVHVDGGPLLQAALDGTLSVGDVIEHRTIPLGTMSMAELISDIERA